MRAEALLYAVIALVCLISGIALIVAGTVVPGLAVIALGTGGGVAAVAKRV